MKQITIFDGALADKGYYCECCGAFQKRYKRSLNCNMSIALIALYKYNVNEFVHLERFLNDKGYQRCGDASYLVNYRFLQKLVADRADGSPRNGMYKITSAGIMFVENKIKAQKHFVMFGGKFQGFEGDLINITEALGKKFNYNELMNA